MNNRTGRKIGHEVTNKTKQLLSLKLKGNKHWKQHKNNCLCPICSPSCYNQSRMKGKQHTKVAKRNIGQSSKQRWNDLNYKNTVSQAISKGKKGIKFTKKHKQNLKKSHKGFRGRRHTKKAKKILSKKLMGHKGAKNQPKFVKHHIYLEKNSDIILKLSVSKHHSLHKRAYDYLYATQGKKGINKYLKWFDKKYNLRG